MPDEFRTDDSLSLIHIFLSKELLAPNIYRLDIEAPRVAQSAKPGQFISLRLDEKGERVPLTIADYDAAKGSVTIVIQTVGYSTGKLCELNPGDMIADFAGPLGQPSEFVHDSPGELSRKRILFVAGGVGTAPVSYTHLDVYKRQRDPDPL